MTYVCPACSRPVTPGPGTMGVLPPRDFLLRTPYWLHSACYDRAHRGDR